MHVELHPRYSDSTEAKRAGELIKRLCALRPLSAHLPYLPGHR